MKKFSWILALLAALAVVFVGVGCGGGGGDNPDDQGTPPDFVSNLGAFEIKLAKNEFEPKGYQHQLAKPELMQGNKVNKGDIFTLDIEFTISRDIDDNLLIYLVDNTAAADWWGRLSCTKDEDADFIPAADLKAGTTITKKIELTAVNSASGSGPAANKLCFETKNEEQILADVTVKFTKFIFSRGEIEDIPEPPIVEVLPEGVVSLGIVYTWEGGEDYQRGWDVKEILSDAEELPTHLLLFVSGGGNGLAGTQIILNSPGEGGTGYAQFKASKDWQNDGTWAASDKLFIIDLTKHDKYSLWKATGLSYNQLGVAFNQYSTGGAINGQLAASKVTSAYLIFNNEGLYDELFDEVCVAENGIDNETRPVMMWFLDDVTELDELID